MVVALLTVALASAASDATGGACDSPENIPIIDITPMRLVDGDPGERARVVSEWDLAMREWGFARIAGHGVPMELVDGVRAAALSFFDEPLEKKRAFAQGTAYGPEGYTAPGVESVGRTLAADELPPDIVENLVVRGMPPANLTVDASARPHIPPHIHGVVEAYWEAMEGLLRVIHTIAAECLGVALEEWDSAYANNNSNALRFAHYPPSTSAQSGQLRYGAHTDYSGFTLLLSDPFVAGLEVHKGDDSDAWVPVPADGAKTIVVNAGDLIRIWSNLRWRSALHRVGNAFLSQRRLSIAFFTGPRDDYIVIPAVRDGEDVRADSTSAGDHLHRKLTVSNVENKGADS